MEAFRLSIFIAMVFLLPACLRQENQIVVLRKDLPAKTIKGEELNIPDLIAPTRIYFTGKSLLFKDNKSPEAQMYVYNPVSQKTNKFIKKGRGPGEMLGAFYFAQLDSNKTTLIYDITLD